jgi:hypothetical protein
LLKYDSDTETNKTDQVLKDKWKFVRNVMDNMERQKKIPLKDSTSAHLNKTTSNF